MSLSPQPPNISRIFDGILRFAGYIVKIAAAWGILVSVLWFVFEPRLRPYIELPAMATELRQTMNEGLDKQGRLISQLREDLDSISPSAPIVEYDTLRSRIVGNTCRIGDICTAEFRVRRTPHGESCDVPRAQHLVRNHFGETRPAEVVAPQTTRLDTDWLLISIRFRLPNGVRPGLGEYFMRLSYERCAWLEPGTFAKETTPPLRFEILPER